MLLPSLYIDRQRHCYVWRSFALPLTANYQTWQAYLTCPLHGSLLPCHACFCQHTTQIATITRGMSLGCGHSPTLPRIATCQTCHAEDLSRQQSPPQCAHSFWHLLTDLLSCSTMPDMCTAITCPLRGCPFRLPLAACGMPHLAMELCQNDVRRWGAHVMDPGHGGHLQLPQLWQHCSRLVFRRESYCSGCNWQLLQSQQHCVST